MGPSVFVFVFIILLVSAMEVTWPVKNNKR